MQSNENEFEEKEEYQRLSGNRGPRQRRLYESVMLEVMEEAKRCLEEGKVKEGFTKIKFQGSSATS